MATAAAEVAVAVAGFGYGALVVVGRWMSRELRGERRRCRASKAWGLKVFSNPYKHLIKDLPALPV